MPCSSAIALACVLLVPPWLFGQSKSDAAKVLGQTPENGTVPFWTMPSADAKQELGKVARSAERGVFLVGYPRGGHGTAWVISKKNRLLITNAHVADIMHETGGKLLAIPNGTSDLYKVEKAYYHPGVRRYFKGGKLSVRSTDPKDGDVDPSSPDLAVLQLSAGGPDLPVEFPLATEEELKSLLGQPAAIYGFPGHDTKGWPQVGDSVAATYHEGAVSRVTDFQLGVSTPPAERQYVQYTMYTWAGYSGSPVFLPNGHILAVHNMARYKKGDAGDIKAIAYGIRADSVLELLVHHGLDDKVPFKIDMSKVLLERWLNPDPEREKALASFAKAEELVGDANFLFLKRDLKGVITKCDDAVKLWPTYAPAYHTLALAWNNRQSLEQRGLSDRQKADYLAKAEENARIYTKLMPSDPKGVVLLCSIKNNQGIVFENQEPLRLSQRILTELLDMKEISDKVRAQAHGYRGATHSFLGDPEAARRDYDQAIRLGGRTDDVLWENRAGFWEKNGRSDLAAADRAKAAEVRRLNRTGMKLTDVKEGGIAHKAGLRAGDVIFNVDNGRVRSYEELTTALKSADGPVEINAWDPVAGREKNVTLTPDGGKIGVAVEPLEY